MYTYTEREREREIENIEGQESIERLEYRGEGVREKTE